MPDRGSQVSGAKEQSPREAFRNTGPEAIAADLAALGVAPGDTVLVHSSFKSLGPVAGGMESVVRGFLHAIGPDGTLMMPALTWALRPPEIFDVRRTPVNVGAIPEYFRNREGTRRSLHPTHSVCATGPRTGELLDGHLRDTTPCGPRSPFRKNVETGGKIVLLGCGLGPNTTMHALEEYVKPPYLFGRRCVFTLRDHDGRTHRRAYTTHGFRDHGYVQRYDRVREVLGEPHLRRGWVLRAETWVLDASALKTAAVPKLREYPLFFVEPRTA